MKILNHLLEELGSAAKVAEMLNITRTAVHGWIHAEKRHPTNENTRQMIEILESQNVEVMQSLIREEFETFKEIISERFKSGKDEEGNLNRKISDFV